MSREYDIMVGKGSQLGLVCVDTVQLKVELVRQSGMNKVLMATSEFSSSTGCSHTACSPNKHVSARVSSVRVAHDIVSDIIIIESTIT